MKGWVCVCCLNHKWRRKLTEFHCLLYLLFSEWFMLRRSGFAWCMEIWFGGYVTSQRALGLYMGRYLVFSYELRSVSNLGSSRLTQASGDEGFESLSLSKYKDQRCSCEAEMVKKFPTFYGTVSTEAGHWSLPIWVRWRQSNTLTSILMSSSICTYVLKLVSAGLHTGTLCALLCLMIWLL